MAKKTYKTPFFESEYEDTEHDYGLEVTGKAKFSTAPGADGEPVRYEDIGSGGLAAPEGATYIVVSLSGNLSAERRLQVGIGLQLTDGGANGDLTVAFNPETDVGALIDNSGGTANSTIQALTDPADTPLTADALRDDLVANLIPELRNNFADLVAQVNAIRTVLQNMGITT